MMGDMAQLPWWSSGSVVRGNSDGDDTFAQGIFHQLNAVMDIKLGHKVGTVALYRFGADNQGIGYFLGSITFCQQFEYFPFPIGKFIVRVVAFFGIASPLIIL